jgi:hypothetical protein
MDELTATPGVGKYNLSDRSMELKTPSVSKKGYGVSIAAKLPIFADTGVPGPCSYSPKMVGVGDVDTRRVSTAFLPSGNGRVPFPAPNKVPGPNAYEINHDPGTPALLKKKKSFYFESTERRGKFLDVNDIPPPLSYDAFKPLPGPKHDVEWSRSSHKRFDGLFPDNKVPGPERYFQDIREEENFPRKSLRTAGSYRGRYLGKLQDNARRPPTTFGADHERAKGWFLGRLDLKAQIPGPGEYFEGGLHSSFEPMASPPRSLSPIVQKRISTTSSVMESATSKNWLIFIIIYLFLEINDFSSNFF